MASTSVLILNCYPKSTPFLKQTYLDFKKSFLFKKVTMQSTSFQ